MRRLIAIAVVAFFLIVGHSGGPNASLGQEVPTPRGQLGGREPLPPDALLPSPPVSTPSPTSVPPATAPPPLSPTATPPGASTATPVSLAPEDVAARVRPMVATVVVLADGNISGTPSTNQAAMTTGSGFFVDRLGHLVTSAGVVGDARTVVVVLADGAVRTGRVVGIDPFSGVAVVRVEGEVPVPLPIAERNPPAGQQVLVLGTPFGAWPQVVQTASVEAIGRLPTDVPASGSLLQLDARNMPGTAGGPVVNLAGEAVGVLVDGDPAERRVGLPDLPGLERPNRAGRSPRHNAGDRRQRQPTEESPSFAIPAETLRRVSQALIANRRVAHSFLGIGAQPVTPLLAAERGLPAALGLLIETVVPGGPAASAGLAVGDTLLSVDGEAIGPERDIASILDERPPGTVVRLIVSRDTAELTIEVVLGERPADDDTP